MSTTTLSPVNPTPAATWNHLSINHTTIEVPDVLPSVHKAAEVNPSVITPSDDQNKTTRMTSVPAGSGKAAELWLDAHASRQIIHTVSSGSEESITVELSETGNDFSVASTSIIVEQDAYLRLHFCIHSNVPNFYGCVTRIIVQKRAHVDIVLVHALEKTSTYLDSLGITLDDEARATVAHHIIGEGNAYVGVAADLNGAGSNLEYTANYLAHKNQVIDLAQTATQRGSFTSASLYATGVMLDGSEKTLRSTIDLVPGCKGSVGTEHETVILAGDDLINKTLPSILCAEEDVAAEHGATIGTFTDEQLAYLYTRGLTRSDVNQLATQAVFDRALHATENPTTRSALLRARDNQLGTSAFDDLPM